MTTSDGTPGVLGDVRGSVPDLVIEELHADGRTADSLCSELKADSVTRHIPVILVVPEESRRRAERARPDVLLLKPVVPRELFEAVNRYVPLPVRRALRYEVNLRFGFEFEGREMQAFTRNLSLNGAFIKTDRVLPEGAHVRLRFTIPGDHREVNCGGLVRQSVGDAPANRQTPGLGVEFEGISDADLARLEAYITSRGRKSRFH
jgi:uncharacterized protein (TIGR02266 family)